MFSVLSFLACLLCLTAGAKVKQRAVYLFGFATTFTDSVGYVTDVQRLDSSYIDVKTKFLIGRNLYSSQLQQYLEENEGSNHPVTSIFFGKKKEKMEKRLQTLRRRYEKEKGLMLKTIPYQFRAEKYEEELTQSPEPQADGKEVAGQQKKDKKEKKEKKNKKA